MTGRFKPVARTYVRPMDGWWRRNPYFVRYMIREGSAIFLAAYALVLLVGLFCLCLGEGAYDLWRAALATKVSVAFHALALILVGYHSYTWFTVMPKTAPDLPIDPRLITRGAFAAAAGLSLLIVLILLWVTR
jgi:fumarate reductase subunit C